ncbi:MAG: hypothetical protein C0399_01715 [Syntrophus sp. (in: bacteria)]|nr:hypothetical protein [Syntrophus sp. (in: bacteria)]
MTSFFVIWKRTKMNEYYPERRAACSILNMKGHVYFRSIIGSIVFVLLLVLTYQPVAAISPADAYSPATINDAAMKLVRFCTEPKVGLDEQAVATLVDYVLSSKQNREYGLPKSLGSTGAYYEFDARTTFPRFMEYSYSALIPPTITRPSSLRYSVWTGPKGETQKFPDGWKQVPPAGAPVIIHGIQRESDTPDLNTGVYHEYDLKRTLILLNHKGQQVLVSISKQIGQSNVGKKGAILGNDSDWNYYYSGEPGTTRAGLGWVKSYIYEFFSIGIYAEPSATSATIRSGVFQWLRAGWSGINFVKSSHILNGMKRFARDCKMILESPRLPAPQQISSVYHWLLNIPSEDLLKKYAALQQAQRSLAIQTGKISKSEGEEKISVVNIPKEQMVEELMQEYIKMTLGKPALLGKQSFQAPM